MKYTFAIHTLGCKVNTYESDAISQSLKERGFEEVPFSEKADIYIINTCTVTNIADKKSRQMLHRARKQNPDAIVAAAGCYVDAAMKNESMSQLLSDRTVDIFAANKDKGELIRLIEERLSEKGTGAEASADPDPETGNQAGEKQEACRHDEADGASAFWGPGGEAAAFSGLKSLSGHTRAFIKIQDGCNQFCSYCIIPYVRGRIRSRDEEDVIREARSLSENGISELVLSGIHLSSYGRDRRDRDESAFPLIELIRKLSLIEGIKRIRLGSLEPRLITEDFARELSSIEKLCPSFHLALQSGSDTVLRRMNRHYTTEEYAESCRLIRKYFQDPSITTDMIVGFPQETEEEFLETLGFAERIGFYEANIFKYSRRAGTVADRMEGQVPEQLKSERSERLIKLCEKLSEDYRRSFLGKELEMLCEERKTIDGEEYVTGYTREYVRCLAKAPEFERNRLIRGTAEKILREAGTGEYILLG